jgi:nitrate reductase beta subunit
VSLVLVAQLLLLLLLLELLKLQPMVVVVPRSWLASSARSPVFHLFHLRLPLHPWVARFTMLLLLLPALQPLLSPYKCRARNRREHQIDPDP